MLSEDFPQLGRAASYDVHGTARQVAGFKDLIKIGRGGADRWVDLKLTAKKDVSREHLQLRRDPASGQIFIKDLSSLGTTVNGRRIPSSIERVNGEEADKNIEVQLPAKARIGLAGVVFLDFRAIKEG